MAKQKIEEAMSVQTQMSDSDSAAIGLYAVLARDSLDFLDMCDEASDETLATLYLMLSTPNEKHDYSTRDLNKFGAQIVAGIITNKRGNKLPEPVRKPDPVPDPKDTTSEELAAKLMHLCSPMAEAMPDGVRLTEFVKVGVEAVARIRLLAGNHKACSKILQQQMDVCENLEARAEALEAKLERLKKDLREFFRALEAHPEAAESPSWLAEWIKHVEGTP